MKTTKTTTQGKHRQRRRVFDRGKQLSLCLHARLGSGTLKLVLLVLLDYYGQNARCTPSHQTIADCANISRRSAMRAIHELAKLAVIKVTGRVDDAGDRTSNLYDIDFARLEQMQIQPEDEADIGEENGDESPVGGDTVSPPTKSEVVTESHHGGSDSLSPPGDTVSRPVVTELHHGGDTVSQEPPIEPPNLNPSPLPPSGEPDASAGSAPTSREGEGEEEIFSEADSSESESRAERPGGGSADANTTQQWAELILANYPGSPKDNRGDRGRKQDLETIAQCIEHERGLEHGAKPEELLAVARSVAAAKLNNPRFASWYFDPANRLSERGYFSLVLDARQARIKAADDARRRDAVARQAVERTRRDDAAVLNEKQRADAALADLDDAELAKLKDRVVNSETGSLRELLSKADPKTHTRLRMFMARLLENREVAA